MLQPLHLRPRPALVLAVALFSLAGTRLRADSYPRQPGLDVLHYVFELTLRDDQDVLEGVARVRVRALQDLREVALDLASESSGKGMKVGGVEAAGRPVRFTHTGDRLVATFEAPLATGAEETLIVRYSGVPASGFHFGPNKFGERVFSSDSWPDKARQWIPTVDHPYDKATGELVVTAPAAYQVVANGRLVEEEDLPEGRRRTRWRQGCRSPRGSLPWPRRGSRCTTRAKPPGCPFRAGCFPETGRWSCPPSKGRPGSPRSSSHRASAVPLREAGQHPGRGFQGRHRARLGDLLRRETVATRPIASLVAHEVAHQWWAIP